MLRYVTLLWNPMEDEQAGAAEVLEKCLRHDDKAVRDTLWKCAYELPGMKVFCADADCGPYKVHILPGHRGAVLGAIFRAHPVGADEASTSATEPVSFSTMEGKRIDSSRGQWLTESHWGSYVAFLRFGSGDVRVMRGPMSSLPAYRTSFRGAHLIFSNLADVVALRTIRFTINWNYVASWLLWTNWDAETGLNEVVELRNGESWDIAERSVRVSTMWDPLRIAASDVVKDAHSAEQILRNSVLACTRTWAASFDRVLVLLSGGLDSSIVLGCMIDGARCPEITCLNIYRLGPASDERTYARAVAELARCPLVEVPYAPDVRLERVLEALPFPYPPQTIGSLCGGMQQENVILAKGIQATFDGTDGDGLFGRAMARFAVVDSIHARGLGRATIRFALDAARGGQQTVWHALGEGIVRNLQPEWSPYSEVARDNGFLSDRLKRTASGNEGLARWRTRARQLGVPPGKAYHSRRLCASTGSFYTAFPTAGADAYQISPLRAQPVIEAALRIPLYLLTERGDSRVDRPLARRAFGRYLPREVLVRTSKGGIVDYTGILIKKNIGFIRDTLLDGTLLREGFLDRRALEDAVSDVPSGAHTGLAPLFELVCIEAWLRKFPGAHVKAAVA